MWKLKVSKVYVDTFVAKLSPQPVLILGKIFPSPANDAFTELNISMKKQLL